MKSEKLSGFEHLLLKRTLPYVDGVLCALEKMRLAYSELPSCLPGGGLFCSSLGLFGMERKEIREPSSL